MAERYNLDKIKTFIGDDKTVLLELVDIFLSHTPEMVEKLNEGIKKEDYDQVSFYAHKLKSSIDNFSVNELVEDIRILEHSAKKRSSIEELPVLVSKISSIIEEVISLMKKDFNK